MIAIAMGISNTTKMTEKSPMLSTRVAASQNGSIDTEAAKNEDLPPPRNTLCTPLNLILFILSVTVMAVLIVGIMLLVQISAVKSDYDKRANALPSMIEQVGKNLKTEMNQLAGNLHMPLVVGVGPASMTGLTPEQLAQLGKLSQTDTMKPIQPVAHGPEHAAKDPAETVTSSWRDDKCKNLGKCTKPGFGTPPLVVLSLDGFRRDYMNRGYLKSLEQIRDCGATAERVYPSYPTRTFPNHYTMATGLYPESHGIVANVIYDPSISPNLESMKKANNKTEQFFKGDPIWSQYQRETGRPAACLFWVGCSFNASGSLPKYNQLPYSTALPFKDRADKIVEWLSLPAETRPGLVMAYYDEPDNIGHFFKEDNKVNDKLRIMEEDLDYLFSSLHKAGLFECVNLMIVSDHGMQQNIEKYFMDEKVNMDGLIGVKGVIGRIYKNGTKLTDDEIMKPFSCTKKKDMRVFPRSEVPTRKHYSKTAAIGEFILQGEAGTMFFPNREDYYPLAGDHGYDYLMENMHTVFFARGPSIKKGAVLQPFQNIEYLNLFRDLLGLSTSVPNNGTAGVMDDMLVNPPKRLLLQREKIRECTLGFLPGAATCGDCPDQEQKRLNARLLECSLNIGAFQQKVPKIVSNGNLCFQNFCEKSVIVGGDQDGSVMLWERLNKSSIQAATRPCAVSNTKYLVQKDCNKFDPTREATLSASKDSEFAKALPAQVKFSQGFINTVLNELNNQTLEYINRYEELFVISGTTYDRNHDGVKDQDTSGNATHYYRILLRCGSQWTADGSCEKEDQLEVLSFIFPLMEKNRNCLTEKQLFLEYSARLKDVELIGGFELQIPKITYKTAIRLKTHNHLKLW